MLISTQKERPSQPRHRATGSVSCSEPTDTPSRRLKNLLDRLLLSGFARAQGERFWGRGASRGAVIQYCSNTAERLSFSFVAHERVFIAVQSRGLIAIPTSIRRQLGLDQPGAQVEVIERGGEIVLRPHVAVPSDQAWFWSERWQRREREADDAISAGRVAATDGVVEMLAELES